jgi:hypothetical protein
LVVTNADVARLAPMVEEMTKHIPSIDDDDLIEHLRGVVGPIENLHVKCSGGITGIINSLAERETYHKVRQEFRNLRRAHPCLGQGVMPALNMRDKRRLEEPKVGRGEKRPNIQGLETAGSSLHGIIVRWRVAY